MTFLTDQATEYTLDRALTQREYQAMKRVYLSGPMSGLQRPNVAR